MPLSGRVCAGRPADNSKADCAVVLNRLEAKYGANNVVGFGTGDVDASVANFKGGRNNDVMYWSGHGDPNKNGLLQSNSGNFNQFTPMADWASSDALKVIIIASCYAVYTNTWSRWVTAFHSSNIRVVASYRGEAPPAPRDTNIAKAFFNNLNAGKGVRNAWKLANQSYSMTGWAVLSYGDTEPNEKYKMPGWAPNTGATRRHTVYIIRNHEVPVKPINAAYTEQSNGMATPYVIHAIPHTEELNHKALGKGRVTQVDSIWEVEYREDVSREMENSSFTSSIQSATQALSAEDTILNALAYECTTTMAA